MPSFNHKRAGFNLTAAVTGLWLLMGIQRETDKLQKGMALCFKSCPQLQGKGDQTERTISTGCCTHVSTKHVCVPEKSINASEPSL